MTGIPRILFVLGLLLARSGPLMAAEPKPSPDLNADVKLIFAEHCFACHSEAKGKVKGGLDLSSWRAIQKGGASGEVIVPSRSSESLLLQLVKPDGSPHMPPKGQLSAKELGEITKWIDSLPAVSATQANAGRSDHWAFQPLTKPPIPTVKQTEWVRNLIDAFVAAKLESKGLRPSPALDKTGLIRRVYFDLIGLPPSPDDVAAFLSDDSPNAFEKVVDRLLASPAYGERWGRHWLDLARYADTGGFHNDLARPNAWRYRDYVIRSFNDDKPYSQFIREQLAGDEITPPTADALIATGFGRNGPSNDDNMGKTPKDIEKYRLDELDGVMNNTFTAFLGMTLGCARCHDHKYDPISQKDYYRVLAIFNGTAKRELPLPGEEPQPNGKLKEASRGIMALVDVTAKPKPTHMLWRGDVNNVGPEVEPGVPVALSQVSLSITEPAKDAKTTGRRTALAEWIGSRDNPLTYRVLANRIWQHHFGRGIVETSGNFGKSGAKPTHPELLDYLASELLANGGKQKAIHKLILLSATYQQASKSVPEGESIDPENQFLWRQNKRRLEAESVRDSILAIAGTLNPKMGGPGIKPRIRKDLLPASQRNAWPNVVAETPDHWRRSVYIYSKRQLLFPMLELFDAPSTTDVCDRRTTSVVPTQALLLLNDEFTDDQSRKFSERVWKEHGPSLSEVVSHAHRLSIGRDASPARVKESLAFLAKQTETHTANGLKNPDREALVDLCAVLLNCNEFLFVE